MAATWKPLGHGSPSLEARHPFMYAVGATSLEECQLACEQHSSMCDLIVFRPPRLADAGDDAGTLLQNTHTTLTLTVRSELGTYLTLTLTLTPRLNSPHLTLSLILTRTRTLNPKP